MAQFLVDEDMPRSTARVMRQAGYQAEDVRDIGLAGHGDPEVFQAAQQRGAVLVSRDLGFTNVLKFPPGNHAGILVIRIRSDVPPPRVNQEILRVLTELSPDSLQGLLVIIELGRTRVRR